MIPVIDELEDEENEPAVVCASLTLVDDTEYLIEEESNGYG